MTYCNCRVTAPSQILYVNVLGLVSELSVKTNTNLLVDCPPPPSGKGRQVRERCIRVVYCNAGARGWGAGGE